MGLDVGPESVAQFSTAVEKSATIVWNGYTSYACDCCIFGAVVTLFCPLPKANGSI